MLLSFKEDRRADYATQHLHGSFLRYLPASNGVKCHVVSSGPIFEAVNEVEATRLFLIVEVEQTGNTCGVSALRFGNIAWT